MTRRQSSRSTHGTGTDILGHEPRLAERRPVAGVSRVQHGEFKSGAFVPGTRYRVLRHLGKGGMGTVYEVEHTELGKRFVLKALLSELATREDLVARLRNEQRALGRLQHPNIVAVTDAGVTSGNVPFFVMECLEGETLGTRLRRTRRLPIVEALGVALGVLEGLAVAHEIGVVHRDIKPQNIFLTLGSRPKILDFGVAKIADAVSVITKRGIAVGTPRYMSPEQASGERVDGRSDLYALGLVLFESTAGVGPFDDARDANEMLLAHLGRPAPRLGSIAESVTRELDAFVAALLSKAPDDRPPNARAAAAALRVVADRYGGRAPLDGPTPLAGYSETTRRPVALEPATRPDGAAARAIPPFGRGDTTTQRIEPGATRDDTLIDERRGPGGTLFDPTSSVTAVRQQLTMPIDAVRTERLDSISLSEPSGTDPTHTRVPITPSEGSVSVVPAPMEVPKSQRGVASARRFGVAGVVLAAALLLFGLGRWAVAPGGQPKSVATPAPSSSAPLRAAATPPDALAVAAPPATASSDLPERPPTPEAVPRPVATARPSVARERGKAAGAPARPERASNISMVPSTSARAPASLSASPRTRATAKASASLPPGLPGSGL